MTKRLKQTLVLLAAVLVNYAAQVPYYFHQYYIPRHLAPSLLGVVLLGITLIWFIAGYFLYVTGKRFGWSVLLAFLITQVLFYGHSLVLGFIAGGGALAQLRTPSPFLFVIFLIGYINFAVAGYYTWWLVRHRANA